MHDIMKIMKEADKPKDERIRGLFTSGLAWLARILAPQLLNKA